MITPVRLAYGAAVATAQLAARLAPRSEHKLLRSLRARRDIVARYATWGATHRDAARALLWMHAPSVGEGLQAAPVLQHIRSAHPELQLAYTFFSPSAERLARSLDVDFADYLPFDAANDVRAALHALAPRALVFSKLDVWPTLVREAAARGVHLGMVSATLSAASRRTRGAARALLRDAYARLDLVGAVDASDAERLERLGVRASALRITGDTRYDQVLARAASVDVHGALLSPLASRAPTLVAGSTWPADERPLLSAWRRVRARIPDTRLILAPHEPTSGRVAELERWAAHHAIAAARLGTMAARDSALVIVDRVGVLAELYALADVAYVGGGFHGAGLHSVVEPAAFGAPVVTGPRHHGSRDAALLLAQGGARAVSGAAAMEDVLATWLCDDAARREAGERARTVVERGRGAAARAAALVEELLF
ncbi:MAG TPA: glycosyltransferase N-terminal domain-containing protein [Gemmatimonadaceae bacterium]|nr:glycosyltransferase N-terminal domain-containing protein [Gemmatimonadaceae bacterium]